MSYTCVALLFAGFVSQVETVYPDTGITEDTVELKIKMLAEVLLRNSDTL